MFYSKTGFRDFSECKLVMKFFPWVMEHLPTFFALLSIDYETVLFLSSFLNKPQEIYRFKI